MRQHGADTGRSYWAWTDWEWARLCGSSAEQFLAARTLPTEATVRPFLVALGYLLGVHRLPAPGQLQPAAPGLPDLRRRAGRARPRRPGSWTSGASGSAPRQAPAARHLQPGPADQPETAAGRPDHRGVRRAARAPANTGQYREMVYALQRACAALGYCDPRRGPATTTPPASRAPPGTGRVGRTWYATSALSPGPAPSPARSWPRRDGGWLPSIRRSPSRASGPGRPARPGSPPSRRWPWVTSCAARPHPGSRRQADPPRSKAHVLSATRMFFRDCQEWEWIPRRFDPAGRSRCRAASLP